MGCKRIAGIRISEMQATFEKVLTGRISVSR